MKRVKHQVWRLVLRTFGAVAILVVALATDTWAQDSQFLFDPTGNLFLQTAATTSPPQILGHPASQIVAPSDVASFAVVVADTRNVTYQWLFGGNNIPGANADTLLLINVTAASEGQYSVLVANGFGSVTSAPAMLWFDSNSNGLADSWEMAHFGNLNQTATGDYDLDGVSNLDEFWEGTDPTNPFSFNPRLNIQSTHFGVAFAAPPLPYYTMGQVVTVTAAPDYGAAFLGWLGAARGIKPQISFVMTGHKTILASFGPPAPPPVIVNATATPGGISLSWSSAPGVSYQMQYKSDFAQSAWNNLGPSIVAIDYSASAADTTATDVQRFYRVVVLP
ncbi:MAG TPA: immunoglobulin domain-containing protein [Candidatus Acidoferrum sp.]|jgi:hypothetical protein|nr:immunoglobulin domain-containing protein [Candidatus Acidoferrum sp.]